MITNDFIKELEKLDSHFSEIDIDNNLWNGFFLNYEGISEYEKHLISLYIDYFNEVSDYIDDLLLNKSINEINLFLNSKLRKFESIKIPLTKWDDEYKIIIEDVSKELERLKSLECDESNIYYNQSLIRLEEKKEAFQLVYNFLTGNINVVQFRKEIDEWETYENIEEDGWDKKRIDQYYCQIRMERIGREHIEKSLTQLKELSDNYSIEDNNWQMPLKAGRKVEEKDFIFYLHHENKDALMKKLHELLDGKKGKMVAITLKALERLVFISVIDNRSIIYKAMRKEFGDIGSDQGINSIIVKFGSYLPEIEHQEKILKEVK